MFYITFAQFLPLHGVTCTCVFVDTLYFCCGPTTTWPTPGGEEPEFPCPSHVLVLYRTFFYHAPPTTAIHIWVPVCIPVFPPSHTWHTLYHCFCSSVFYHIMRLVLPTCGPSFPSVLLRCTYYLQFILLFGWFYVLHTTPLPALPVLWTSQSPLNFLLLVDSSSYFFPWFLAICNTGQLSSSTPFFVWRRTFPTFCLHGSF